CVVPDSSDHEPTRKLLRLIAESGNASFLTVLKTFGDLPSPGMLSFPKKGVTLALDFPMTGKKILNFLERLDHIVREEGGSVYPAKDARMSPQSFQSFYPNWKEFAKHLDPKFSSSFWRRVTR
ncbi:MAG: FAD-binding protein, partial [Deltaproteobacteria bacterium]|nr:FAD-binding protein [Deltaproteobacteria bacterium]